MNKRNNRRLSIIFIISLFLIFAIIYFLRQSGLSTNIPGIGTPQPQVFEQVPTSYAECIRTNNKYNSGYQNEIELRCQYLVGEEETGKYRECLRIGGEERTLIIDYIGPPRYVPPNRSHCEMVFYNPNFVFPKNLEECEQEKRGGVVGGDGSTQGGVPRKKTCLLSIDVSQALNKQTATDLLNKCIALGGDYNPNQPSCLIRFDEP